jgi:hypothetical protein
MKTSIVISVLATLLIVCFSEKRVIAQGGPYFGQTNASLVPQRFAPAKVPQEAWGISFTPDGMECFITLRPNNNNVILGSKSVGNSWTDFSPASFSGTFNDSEPHISPAGNRVYFGSFRPLPGDTSSSNSQWYSEKTDSGWTEAHPMAAPLTGVEMMYPSVANNGNMYYTAFNLDSIPQYLAVLKFENGFYQMPERLPDSVNFQSGMSHPIIAPDESCIIFDNLHDQTGAIYLYISFHKPDGSWSTAKKLNSIINSGYYNMFPYISRDGKYFFYYRNNYMMWMKTDFIETIRPFYGNYLGQPLPDSTALRFAPPSLQSGSSWWWHDSPVFSPDLTELLIVKYKKSNARTTINSMKQVNGEWTTPQPASFADQNHIEYNPFFSPSGDTLYYYSQKPGGPFFYVVKQNGTWSASQPLNIPVPSNLTAGPGFSIARNRNIYIDFWEGNQTDIYQSQFENGQYNPPEKLSNAVNSDSLDYGPYIDPDERFLIFSSERQGNYGETDLYISYRNTDGTWKPAANMGPAINSKDGSAYPVISPDGQYLFFNSWTSGDLGYNPYWIKADFIFKPLGIDQQTMNFQTLNLSQNFPNPFSESTTIRYSIKQKERIRISLFDIYGREIKVLLDEVRSSGNYTLNFDPGELKSGVYFYCLKTDAGIVSKKLTIVR